MVYVWFIPVVYYDSVTKREKFAFVLQEIVVRLILGSDDTISLVPSLKAKYLTYTSIRTLWNTTLWETLLLRVDDRGGSYRLGGV